VVVVEVHVLASFHPALDRVAHRLGVVVQHLREAIGVALVHPLLLGQVSGELGSILGEEHQSHIVYVRKKLRDGRATPHHPGLQPTIRQGAEQVKEDSVVPIPGVQQGLEQALVMCS
jgi:hypothetical protein